MSLPTLVIGTKNLSSWSLRPWLVFKHLRIAFDEIELPLDTPEYFQRIDRYSPTRRVPTLMDGDLNIWDSLAICEYASELAGGAGWPENQKVRAHARSISAEMHSGFQALRTCWPMNATADNLVTTLTDAAVADIVRIETIWQDCRRKFATRGPWLFGAYSIADAMYAPVVLRFKSYRADLSVASQQYLATTLAETHLQSWLTSAARTRA